MKEALEKKRLIGGYYSVNGDGMGHIAREESTGGRVRRVFVWRQAAHDGTLSGNLGVLGISMAKFGRKTRSRERKTRIANSPARGGALSDRNDAVAHHTTPRTRRGRWRRGTGAGGARLLRVGSVHRPNERVSAKCARMALAGIAASGNAS